MQRRSVCALVPVIVAMAVAGCGSSGDGGDSSQPGASAPERGFSGSQSGKVGLHFNAYGDYGYCTGKPYGQGDTFCRGTYESDADTTAPFCCGYKGKVSVRRAKKEDKPPTCGSFCTYKVQFEPDNGQLFNCFISSNSAPQCYTGRNQPPDLTGKPGGPLRIYVGKSEVYDVRGYLP